MHSGAAVSTIQWLEEEGGKELGTLILSDCRLECSVAECGTALLHLAALALLHRGTACLILLRGPAIPAAQHRPGCTALECAMVDPCHISDTRPQEPKLATLWCVLGVNMLRALQALEVLRACTGPRPVAEGGRPSDVRRVDGRYPQLHRGEINAAKMQGTCCGRRVCLFCSEGDYSVYSHNLL